VSPLVDGVPLFGTGGLAPVTDVVTALTKGTGSTSQVGTRLVGLTQADQTAVLSGLKPLTGPIASLLTTNLDSISGTYRSFPRLSADLSGAPAGSYSGTMTVTFVQQ
jgi:hypothetical protein